LKYVENQQLRRVLVFSRAIAADACTTASLKNLPPMPIQHAIWQVGDQPRLLANSSWKR